MNKIEEIKSMMDKHLSSKEDTADTDRGLLVKVKKLLDEYSEKTTVDAGVENAKPATVYAVKMARMTPQELASLGVQLISVNNSELFWVTSIGQLYAFNNKQAALEAEYAWLMSKPN